MPKKTTTKSGPPPPPPAPPSDSPLADDTGFLPGETSDTLGEGVVGALDTGAADLLSAAYFSERSGGSADFGWANESGGADANSGASAGALGDFTGAQSASSA